jgi:hypothetical protein
LIAGQEREEAKAKQRPLKFLQKPFFHSDLLAALKELLPEV